MSSIMERVAELEAMGFKRWQKGSMDRMYINPTTLGLECDYYKTGNIRYAEFKGQEISNSEGYRIKAAKTYIDLVKGELVSDNAYCFEAAAQLIGLDEYRWGDTRIKL